jgi:hypothetical protein
MIPAEKEREMSENQGYNGWTNRATWSVALWLGGSEWMYRAYSEALKAAPFTAESLEEFVRDLMPSGPPDFDYEQSQYLEVNWLEIADGLNTEKEGEK